MTEDNKSIFDYSSADLEDDKKEYEQIFKDLNDFYESNGFLKSKFQKAGSIFKKNALDNSSHSDYLDYIRNICKKVYDSKLGESHIIHNSFRKLYSDIKKYSEFVDDNFQKLHIQTSNDVFPQYLELERSICTRVEEINFFFIDLINAQKEYKRQEKRLKDLEESGISAAYFSDLGKIIEKKETVITLLNIGIWFFALILGGFSINEYINFDFIQKSILDQVIMKLLSISPFIFLIFLMVRKLRKEEILCEGYRYKASTLALLKVKELEFKDANIRDEKFAQILLHNPLDVLNDDGTNISLEDIKNIKAILKKD